MQHAIPIGRAAKLTGLTPTRLRRVLAGMPLRLDRAPGQWRRLTPNDVLQVAILDAAMRAGVTPLGARASVAAVHERLYGHMPDYAPFSALAACCDEQRLAAGAVEINLQTIARDLAKQERRFVTAGRKSAVR